MNLIVPSLQNHVNMGTMGQFQSAMPRKTKAKKIKTALHKKPNQAIAGIMADKKPEANTSVLMEIPKTVISEKQKEISVPRYFFQDLLKSIITSVAIIGLVIVLFIIQKS